ncbi:hypothetical protein TNIN_186701 [Trichonephila inaurata madagascariensis]|uniref:Uncharacterized protein n=1 Tax=Trichonephila inaurata madagascariensis TaxID=2747483 RepID=A0A8X6WXE3_9ARAC|nr:hypothetical protein TNIN_186701 [Trichonephila inaurata madagascariensis]
MDALKCSGNDSPQNKEFKDSLKKGVVAFLSRTPSQPKRKKDKRPPACRGPPSKKTCSGLAPKTPPLPYRDLGLLWKKIVSRGELGRKKKR